MTRTTTTRTRDASARPRVRASLLAAFTFFLCGGFAWGGPEHRGFQQTARPAPVVRQESPGQRRPASPPANGFAPRSGQNQEHLQQWMQSHGNLTLDQQQRALENEPGFRQLSPEMQQRMHQRLAQLNGMTPEQRQRTYARTEAMERLAPEQRLQVRNALTNLGNLPKDRRMYVAREFRALREMAPASRQVFLNSPAMHAEFSDQERQVLSGLFEVAPFLPPPPQAPVPGVPMPPPLPPR